MSVNNGVQLKRIKCNPLKSTSKLVMIYNTFFPLQKPTLKHSGCVASREGTGGTKPANVSPIYTKNRMKNESIRAGTSAEVNCWQNRFICSANKLSVVRRTQESMNTLIMDCSRLSGNHEVLCRITVSRLLKHWAIQNSDGLFAINLSCVESHLAKVQSTVCF